MIKMKLLCGAAVMVCALSLCTFAQDSIEGHWEGAMVRDGAAQVIKIDFWKDADGLKGRLYTPALPTSEPPPFAVTYESGKIQFGAGQDKVSMTLDSAVGEMIGTLGEATPPIRIHLKRGFKPLEVQVRTEDVEFRNGDVSLSGTLVTPATAGPHPAIVWIHGRGKSGRGQFRGWARILAQRGVASLIYDKRGVGKSTGDHDRSGMNDFAGDALAAVEFLTARKEIDAKQIGLHGSSAGGWVAPIVASRSKTPVAFIITFVGPADSVRDQQIHVAEYNMRQSEIRFTEDEIKAAAEHMRLVQDVAYTGKGWDALRASVAKARQTRWASFVDLPQDDNYEDIVWVRLNQYDPGPDLKKIKVPMLALYGDKDYVVPPQVNVKKLEGYLTEAGNKDFKIVSFPEADHGLTIAAQVRRIGTDPPGKYYWLWRKLAPGVVDTTVEWLLKHVTVSNAADVARQ